MQAKAEKGGGGGKSEVRQARLFRFKKNQEFEYAK